LFLNKLPRELRILLSEADKQALGARVDLFASHNSKQGMMWWRRWLPILF
jgi:hypothetical protein